MKTTYAETLFKIVLNCPYCDNYQYVTDNLKELLGNELSVFNIDKKIKCEKCGKTFIVDEIIY